MTTILNPTYEIENDDQLSKFLLGAIRDVRKQELKVEEAEAISQLTDKYIKLKVARILEERMKEKTTNGKIAGEINKALMQKTD